ncbi:MAG TPA: hypothetical protein VK897_12300 [Anaerolineales bacterium]|nr:hypothetical protein [Anaerolineales bacterium]
MDNNNFRPERSVVEGQLSKGLTCPYDPRFDCQALSENIATGYPASTG